MKIRMFITMAVALTALMLPSAASAACNAGVANDLTVVPPAALAEGQTQHQNFTVTACTSIDHISVEWVKIIQSNQPWMGKFDSSNRTTVVAETTQTVSTSLNQNTGVYTHTGATTFTVPVGLADGHYAVITRYYARGVIEAQGGSSFSIVTPDVCSNIAGKQQSIPAGLVDDGAGNCVEDKCPNLGGVQQNIPAGYFVDASGNCIPDVCPNVAGNQPNVPTGYFLDGAGNCMPDVCPNLTGIQQNVPSGDFIDGAGSCIPDACPNLTGNQSNIPSPYVLDVTGNCVIPPTDVCANIAGVQITVPAGRIDDGAGNCVIPPTDVCANIAGVQTTIPAGRIDDEAGNCNLPPVTIVDYCPNIDGQQDSLPSGFTLVAGTCTIIAKPTGETPTPLNPSPWITKVASVKQTKTNGRIVYTIKAGNHGPGTLKAARICDRLPAGTIYVSNSGTASFAAGSICWKARDIAPGKSVTVKLTVKVSGSFKGKRITNTACVTSANAAKKCAKAIVKVKVIRKEPVGGVTG